MNSNEAASDLVLIIPFCFSHLRAALLPFKSHVTENTTVKGSIAGE